jgi:hypothetical protein
MTETSGKAKIRKGPLAGVWDLRKFIHYNVVNVFSGRAGYFMLLAGAVFLLILVLNLLGGGGTITAQKIYEFLLVPGVLLVFYPAVFAIQSDRDSGMIEVLFGIPDYRYKIWLVRSISLYLVTAALLFVLAAFCRVGLADFPLGTMVFQAMIPVIFVGSLAFFTASQTGNGVATAVILIVVVLAFWLFRGQLAGGAWYLFYNPFVEGDQVQSIIMAKTTFANRLYLVSGSLFLTMMALLRLQKREKFI